MFSKAVFNKRVTRPAGHVHALGNEGVQLRSQTAAEPTTFNLQEYLQKNPPSKTSEKVEKPVDTIP